jgi:hypothetical protein
LIGALNGIMALSRQLGGGQLVLRVVSARTGRSLEVDDSALATFAASVPDRAVPLHVGLGRDG